jgi:hypothetical protein
MAWDLDSGVLNLWSIMNVCERHLLNSAGDAFY